MIEESPGIAAVQKGITPADSTVRTVVGREIVPDEVYMGKRSFGKESQDVVIETGTYDSEQSLGNILKTVLSKRDKAKELRNIAFNSFYCDSFHRIYIVSISSNVTLKDVLARCPFSIPEKGFLALEVCNEVKKIHCSSDVHNGLSLERVLVSDWDLVLLTNYFNRIPSSVRAFLPEELVGPGSTMHGSFSTTRYNRESIDVFETALILYEIFTGRKPGSLKEYKLTDEERRVLGQSLQTAPDSIGQCFRSFNDIGFTARKAGDYAAVFPKLFSALVSSAASCGTYLLERVSKNTLKEYLVTVLDKKALEEHFGPADYGKSPEKKNRKKYVVPFVKKDIGGWYAKNGGRYNYVPLLGNFFGFIRKPEERVRCPNLDELIARLKVFEKKKGPDFYGRINDLIGGKKGKNILIEMTELHLKQKKEQIKRERMRRLKRTAFAAAATSLAAALLIAGYLHYSSRSRNVDRPVNGAAGIAADNSQRNETITNAAPAVQVPKTKLYIKREDAKTYTVPWYRSARIDLRYLKLAILDSLNALTHLSADTLPFFKVTSLDKKFLVDYPHKLLLSEKGQKLKPGLYHVTIEVSNPECKSLNTTINVMVTQPSIAPVTTPAQPQTGQPTIPSQTIRPSARLQCSGVYKLEHIEEGTFLDDVWFTEKERFVDQGGTIYLFRRSTREIIAANPKKDTHSYFSREYLLSTPRPVTVNNDDLISRDRSFLEKCLKSGK
jgi:hypothetical protein